MDENYNANNVQNYNQPPQQGTDGRAIASLVLGIIGLVCTFVIGQGIIGLILAIVGLVLGKKAKKENPSGMATAGVVLCWISIIVCIIVVVLAIVLVGAVISLI
ncbi:MAG: DUF4190 domain-containing protein [Firmicutes bacterium]|nr:DUF4190 domain-containing protein [Bacillota bacterium]